MKGTDGIRVQADTLEEAGSGALVLRWVGDEQIGLAAAFTTNEKKINFVSIKASETRLDKTTYRKIVEITRYLSQVDGMASNFIESLLEMNSGGFENRVAEKKGEEGDLSLYFDTACRLVNSGIAGKSRGMDEIRRKFDYNWFVTGLMVWLVRPGTVTVQGKKRKVKVAMPLEMELLDAASIDLDRLLTEHVVAYEFPEAIADEIKDYVIKKKGNVMAHPILSLWPKSVKAGEAGIDAQAAAVLIIKKQPVPLPPDKIVLVRRVFDDSQVYPIPYLMRYFEAARDKQTLREMDRSVMRKIINLILLIKIKAADPEHNPIVTQEMLREAAAAVETSLADSPDRFQIGAVPDTHSYEYIKVPTDSLYARDHYRVLNYEALSALLGSAANQLLSDSGGVDITLIMKILSGKNEAVNLAFKRFLEEVYERFVIAPSRLAVPASGVNIVFKRVMIYETDAFKAMVRDAVARGYLAAEAALELIGEDPETNEKRLMHERDMRENERIYMAAPTYSQTVFKGGEQTTESSLPEGRPAGEASEN